MRAYYFVLTRFYLVLAVLSGLSAGPSRMVLCIEPTGRIVFETGEGRCSDRAPSPNGAVANCGFATLPDGCGDCVDLPMGSDVVSSARHGVSRLAAVPAPFAAVSMSVVSAVPPAAVLHPAGAALAHARAWAPPSRSAILRI